MSATNSIVLRARRRSPCASIHVARARLELVEDLADAPRRTPRAVSRISVCANSLRKPATRSPSAHSSPGEGGTITGNEPISSATAFACSGRRRRRRPARTRAGRARAGREITRSAPAMFSLTIAQDALRRLLDRSPTPCSASEPVGLLVQPLKRSSSPSGRRAAPGSRSPGRGSACRPRTSTCWSLGGDRPPPSIHVARPRLELVEHRRAARSSAPRAVSRISVLRELVAEAGHQVAQRAQQPGRRRHDHREGAHQLGDRVGVQRARAAEGDQRELARVVAALDADRRRSAPAMFSLTIRRMPVGGLLEASPIASATFCTARSAPPRRRAPSRRRSGRGGRCPSDDVGVGHRRLRAALAVRRRARAPRPRTAGRRAARRSARARARSSRRPRRRCARRRSGP